MLSTGACRTGGPGAAPRPSRTRTMAQAWRPCARGLPLPTLAAAAGLAGAPTLLVLVRGGHGYGGALVAAALACGVVAAFAVEDPTEETLAASPTSLARRRTLRMSAIGLGVAVVAVVLVAVAATAGGGPTVGDLGRRVAELAAASGLAGAAAGTAQRQATPGAAPGGAVVGLLGILLVAALAHRFPSLPALVDGPHHARWWVVAAGGWVLAAWTWRDPAR